MKIVVDIDDVLADTMPQFIAFFREFYNQDFLDEDASKFEYLGFLGKTKEEATEKLFKFYESEYFEATQPIEKAQDVLKKLRIEHELYALTSRPYAVKNQTEEWIEKYFPNIFTEILFNNDHTKESFSLDKLKSKAEICKDLDAHVLIDDLLRFTNNSHEELNVYLLDKPWNKGEIQKNVKRVSDWDAIFDIISS